MIRQLWRCPECRIQGEVTLQEPVMVLDVITGVAEDHRALSPECRLTHTPSGFTQLILMEQVRRLTSSTSAVLA